MESVDIFCKLFLRKTHQVHLKTLIRLKLLKTWVGKNVYQNILGVLGLVKDHLYKNGNFRENGSFLIPYA